jgi:putative membrane protein
VWLTGTHVFPKEGFLKYLYLVILFSHMLLAVCVVPMVFRALFLARKERFEEHRVLARWLWPVWMYVGVTGVLVYVLLYHAAYWF